jgi:ATP-dependent phosphoenolpyruvate carboxykinase
MEAGIFNPTQRVEDAGMIGLGSVHYNLNEAGLMQAAVVRGEGEIGIGGAFLCNTGKHTGRSPKDKFVVREPSVEADVWWENNPAMEPEAFERLHQDMLAHMRGGEYFVQDLYAGADPAHRLNVRLVNELAWHGLFIRHMLRRPEISELAEFTPEFTIINCPTFKADPARHGCRSETIIAVSFTRTAPARPHSRLTPRAPCWATTSMAGPIAASSTSRAAATPRPSTCRPRPSRRSTTPPRCSAPWSRTWSTIRTRARWISRMTA